MSVRTHARGVTPFVVVVAAAVAAVGVSGAWFMTQHAADAKRSSSYEAAAHIRTVALRFRADNGDGCPSFSELREEKLLERDARGDDAWGQRYRIRCDADDVVVSSAGPDGVADTKDDIRVPR